MTTYEDTRYISLNTQHGTPRPNNGTYLKSFLSHIDFNFPALLQEDEYLYAHIDIVNCQIPVSFYNIYYASNTLKYSIDNGAILTLTIPVGNYNISTLKNEMKAQFLNAGYVFTILFNESTNKYSFTNSLYDFSFKSIGSTLLETIGFDSVNNYVSSNKTLISEHCCSLTGIKKLKISSVSLATSAVSSGGGGDILGIVPVDAGPRQIINYSNNGNRKALLKNRIVDSIDLMIKDENNNFVNFNNVEYSLTLALTITRLYKNNIKSLIGLFSNTNSAYTLENTQQQQENTDTKVPFSNENDLDFFMYQNGYNTGG